METRSTLAGLQRRFVPPRGLDRSRPRDVRFTAGGKALLVAAILLFAGAVAAGIGLQRAALRDAAVRQSLRDAGAYQKLTAVTALP